MQLLVFLSADMLFLTHYLMNYFSVEVTFSLHMNYFTQVHALTAIIYTFVTQPPINELAIVLVTALSWQPLAHAAAQTGIKLPNRKCAPYRARGLFSQPVRA